ncbi:ABC-type transport auxiliary lipoprotein family protein [Tsuneonella sp. YG55]|uniref:ABC-type transport auxiliary lipoprotein family protein n=1 Tax=Tsuneonella litorea TaxID=2976475 RepID=A0A9X2W1G9_9SPHN|nr:ABC-type transport auxiliary lipoprotein family protein [Tsuneonella litorea]MCT2559012.1 ABC-type transport auxiliary lipoprotein family protein [Tsuneonella litorea]
MKTTRVALASALVLLLAGCISLGGKAPENLLGLTPTASVAAGTTISGDIAQAIQVNEPEAPARLAVTRVPVQIDDTRIAYLKDAVWADRPTRLFRKLLGETIRAKTGRLVIDYDDPALTPKNQLRGTLIDFGYDARTSSVVVTFDAVRDVNGTQVMTRRFSATVPGVAPEAAPVGTALNQAANEVAGQVADWIG